MKNSIKRLIALVLSICMIGTLLPVQILAEEPQQISQGERPASLATPTGEIPVEEDWNEAYPYGTFAFGTYQADVAEPGALSPEGAEIPQTALLPVYRIGGTTGRVTVRVTYAPAVTTDQNGVEPVYDYAASGKQDLLIEVEDPNPLAAYQEIGLPLAERTMEPAEGVGIHAERSGENGLLLSLENADAATGWRWQYKTPAGCWKDVESANEDTLELTWQDFGALGMQRAK